MSSLKLFLLGPPRLERDGVPLEFDTRKNAALVAYLALTGETYTREALVTLLWPELEPSRARAGLRRNLSMLRKTLGGEWLVVDRETVGTDPGAEFWLDVEQFRRLLQAWHSHGHPESDVCPECLTLLAEAIELYRGDFLAGFTLRDSASFDEWQFFQTESLRGELASALERLVRGYTAQGAYESAIPYARRWLALDPLHEPAHRHLMQLYAACNQRAAALRQYEECERILEAELDLAPSEETVSLYRQIRTRPADRGEPPPPAPRPRHNLPAQSTPFVGREAQLAEVRWQLTCSDPGDEVRLLTLSGTGGTGKTRLALQVAADLLDDFDDGVFFVALTPIRDPALVIPTIAQTLGLREVEGQPFGSAQGRPLLEVLKGHLRDRDLLLVLDSFDRVTEAAPVVSDLLSAAPRLKVLVTSRVLLRVRGEHVYPVPPLALPEPKELPPLKQLARVEAVQLFVQRVQAVKPGFGITDENAWAVTEICRRLEGLPLAIELAAARVRLLPPQKMLLQLGSRFRLLTGGARDLPTRHQTLHGAIDWSYDLLDDEEKVLFRRLAVFVSGCTLEAVDTVCLGRDAGREVQAESLLTPQDGESLPFIVRRSSLDLLESLVDQSLLKSSDVNGEPRFEMLETLHDYALERLIDSGEVEAIRWRHANFFLVLAEEAEPKMRSVEQVAWLNRLEMEYGNLRAALTWFKEKAINEQEETAMLVPSEVEGSLPKEPALSLPKGLRLATALYRFWLTRGSWSEGREWLTQFLALSTTSPRTAVRAKALNRAGLMAWWQRDYASARSLHVESLEIYQELNDKRGIAASLFGLGRVARGQGDYASARASYEESLEIRRDLGDRWGIANTLLSLGVVVFFFQDNLAPARSLLEESLAIWRELDIKSGIAPTLSWLGRVLQRQGNYEQAEALCLESLTLFRELGYRLGLAYTLHNLGCAALCQNDRGRAATHFTESLALYRELKRQDGIIECLAGLAAVAVAEGQLEWAAQLFGAAEALLEATGAHLAAADRAEWDRNLAAVRAQLDEETFAAAWAEGQARDLDATVAELLDELGGQ